MLHIRIYIVIRIQWFHCSVMSSDSQSYKHLLLELLFLRIECSIKVIFIDIIRSKSTGSDIAVNEMERGLVLESFVEKIRFDNEPVADACPALFLGRNQFLQLSAFQRCVLLRVWTAEEAKLNHAIYGQSLVVRSHARSLLLKRRWNFPRK